MKVAVIGSRTFTNYQIVKETLLKVIEKYGSPETIISGGALGADTLAEKYAKENNIPTLIFKPDYTKYPGKMAPIMRNFTIVDNSDIIVAFWDKKSPGTKSSLEYALRKEKKIVIYDFINNLLEIE